MAVFYGLVPMPPMPPEPQLLLAHADFVRGLAAALLADPHAADDVAQETFVTALSRPPRHTGNLGGWLARTVQSLASNARRSEHRRRQREAHARPPEPVPSPADVMAREQVRQQVVDAVLALEPPSRDAVLLRYWEGLSPSNIARRLGVPSGTVRSRLKRGLDQLRARLEANADWRAALAPLAGVHAIARPLVFLPLVLVMKKFVFAAALVLLVGLLAISWWPAVTSPSAVGDSPPAHVVAADGEAEAPVPSRTTLGASDVRLAAPGAPLGAAMYPALRPVGHVHGQVFDDVRRPIAGARVELEPHMGNLPAGEPLRDDREGNWSQTSSADGTFGFTAVPAGPWVLRATRAGRVATAAVVIGAGQDEGPFDLVLEERHLDGDHVVVHVVTAAGAPVAGAEVEGYVHSATSGLRDGTAQPPLRGTSAADGTFVVRGLRLVSGVFVARLGEATGMGTARLDQPFQTVRVTLRAAGVLRGRLSGASADLLAGARVRVHALSSTRAYSPCVGRTVEAELAGDEFVVPVLPAGVYGLTLSAPRGLRLVLGPFLWGGTPLPNSVTMQTAEVRAGETTEIELPVTLGGTIEGRVLERSAAGSDASALRPVAGARVRAVLAPRTSNFPAGFVLHGAHVWRLDGPYERGGHNPQSHLETTTDAEGRYALRGLQPGQHRVEVFAPGLSYDRRVDVEVRDGATVVLEHELARAGVVQIGTAGTSYVGIVPAGSSQPVMLAIGAHSVLTFPGVAAGRFTVTRFHSDADVAPRPLVEVVVEAGRTTWVDLRPHEVQAVVTGIVRGSGGPLAGAGVSLHPHSTRTAADGSFELRLHYRPRAWATWGPTIAITAGGLVHNIRWPEALSGSSAPHLDLRLGEHGLAVHTLDAQGRPTAALVEVAGQHIRGRIAADVGGRAEAAHLQAGKYNLRAQLPDGSEVATDVEVPAAAPVALRALPGGVLRVRVTRGGVPHAGMNVDAHTWTGGGDPPAGDGFAAHAVSRGATTGSDGIAEFRGIAAGHVRVLVGDGYPGPPAVRRTKVAAGAKVELAVELR